MKCEKKKPKTVTLESVCTSKWKFSRKRNISQSHSQNTASLKVTTTLYPYFRRWRAKHFKRPEDITDWNTHQKPNPSKSPETNPGTRPRELAHKMYWLEFWSLALPLTLTLSFHFSIATPPPPSNCQNTIKSRRRLLCLPHPAYCYDWAHSWSKHKLGVQSGKKLAKKISCVGVFPLFPRRIQRKLFITAQTIRKIICIAIVGCNFRKPFFRSVHDLGLSQLRNKQSSDTPWNTVEVQ